MDDGSSGRLWLTVLAVFSILGLAQASDLKISAVLVWATNEETSPDPKHKPLDPVLANALGSDFKWKHYFEVRRKDTTIANGNTNKFVMSEKCTVEVKKLANERISAFLFGDGKPGVEGKFSFPPGRKVALAGPLDDHNSAWFVVLQNTAAPAPAAAAAVASNKPPPAVPTNAPPKSN